MTIISLKSKDVPDLRTKILKKDQFGKCPICEIPIKDDACLDHEHKKRVGGTGQIRGVLCRKCNIFIAKSENNCVRYGIDRKELPRILRNTATYLEKDQYPFLHPSEVPKAPILKKSSYNTLKKAYKGTRKFPLYVTRKKKGGRVFNAQKMNKTFEKLFKEYNIQPEFY